VSNPSTFPILDCVSLSACPAFENDVEQRAYFDKGCVILVDKPASWTSFDVVNKVRRLTKAKRVGHSGTLDPFATGLLIICTGKATKSVTVFQDQPKTYETVFEFGKETDTLDIDGELTRVSDRLPTESEIVSALANFRGTVEQVPPAYSALKIGGTPSYRLARKGKATPLAPRNVQIFSFEMIDFATGWARFVITCSKGTYVRSLARDLGKLLGSAAFVRELRRKAIGDVDVSTALTIEDVQQLIVERRSSARHP